MKNKQKIVMMVVLSILSALIIVLQIIAKYIKFGEFQPSLVLIPIAVGAILYGPIAGGYLGALFGLVVLLNGDAAAFIHYSPVAAVLTVLLKGALAGVASGFAFKLLKKVNMNFAIIVAAILTPIVNTGIFALSSLTIFQDGIKEMIPTGEGIFTLVFVSLIGFNFFVEFGLTAVLSPAIVRICQLGFDQLNLKK